jgi:hypothetical protein
MTERVYDFNLVLVAIRRVGDDSENCFISRQRFNLVIDDDFDLGSSTAAALVEQPGIAERTSLGAARRRAS